MNRIAILLVAALFTTAGLSYGYMHASCPWHEGHVPGTGVLPTSDDQAPVCLCFWTTLCPSLPADPDIRVEWAGFAPRFEARPPVHLFSLDLSRPPREPAA
ncbi:MAG: hypothetical protein OEW05_01875 [Candidatus Aminicenantes bacterium]|nr:hypothetical protein [Candidatus Aminicenantes bacterium]